MSLNNRLFTSIGPQEKPPRPRASDIARRLRSLMPADHDWHADLALARCACRGMTIAQIAECMGRSVESLRSRWSALTALVADDGQPFGIWEQEALLLALTDLATARSLA